MVDACGHRAADRDGHRLGDDPHVGPLALQCREHLRVGDPVEIETRREDHRCRNEGAGQGAAAGLVGAADESEALLAQVPLVAVQVGRRYPSHRIRDGGQMITKARPTMSPSGIGPRPNRESFEFVRLSPMTKTWSAGILVGG